MKLKKGTIVIAIGPGWRDDFKSIGRVGKLAVVDKSSVPYCVEFIEDSESTGTWFQLDGLRKATTAEILTATLLGDYRDK